MLKNSEVNAVTQAYIQQTASHLTCQYKCMHLILDFKLSRSVLNVVHFLPDNSPVSEFYTPTFRTLSLFHLQKHLTQMKTYNIVSLHTKPE